MENETIWRSRVQHDSERDVALRGGPTGFIGGADILEQKLSERLSWEAEIARRAKLAAAVLALRRRPTKAEAASVLATVYRLGLTPRERVPLIRTLRARGFTQGEIIEALWRVEEGPGYEAARVECEKAVGAAES